MFCAHDEIKDMKGGLGDFNWIDLSAPKTRSGMLRMLPSDGSRRYSRQAAQFCLRHGVCAWDHITHTFSVTADLPSYFLCRTTTSI